MGVIWLSSMALPALFMMCRPRGRSTLVISSEAGRGWCRSSLRRQHGLLLLLPSGSCCSGGSLQGWTLPGAELGASAGGLCCVVLGPLLSGLGFVLNQGELCVECSWPLPG